MLAFSTTDRDSFDAIRSWKSKVENECGPIAMCICQNKVDLIDQSVVEPGEAEALAKELGLKFYRICVKENFNVDKVFDYLVDQWSKAPADVETAPAVDIATMVSVEGTGRRPIVFSDGDHRTYLKRVFCFRHLAPLYRHRHRYYRRICRHRRVCRRRCHSTSRRLLPIRARGSWFARPRRQPRASRRRRARRGARLSRSTSPPRSAREARRSCPRGSRLRARSSDDPRPCARARVRACVRTCVRVSRRALTVLEFERARPL